MKIEESGFYLLLTIESEDWRRFGRELLETIKSIPGRVYNPYNKTWKIHKSQHHLLSSYLPPFTLVEERQGDLDLQEFLNQFDVPGF